MLTYFDLRRGVRFILDDQPYEVLDSLQVKTAQRRPVMRIKAKNLIMGQVIEKTFQQADKFEEAEINKADLKFLYSHKDSYCFCKSENPSERFNFTEAQIGENAKFLKSNQILQGIIFDDKIVNISLPIKVELKVTDAPPGVKGDRASSGNKMVTLESGARINVPLFIQE